MRIWTVRRGGDPGRSGKAHPENEVEGQEQTATGPVPPFPILMRSPIADLPSIILQIPFVPLFWQPNPASALSGQPSRHHQTRSIGETGDRNVSSFRRGDRPGGPAEPDDRVAEGPIRQIIITHPGLIA